MANLYQPYFFIGLILGVFSRVPANAQAPNSVALTSAGPALKTYHGEYDGGQATYTYYLAGDGQRVRHGRFELVKKSSYSTYAVSERGTYAHGQRTGPWTTTKTEYGGLGGRAVDITNRTTTTETYAHGRLDGPATYANVPWKAGKPGPPKRTASAIRRTQTQTRTLAVRKAYHFRGDETQLAGRDTTIQVTEFGAGPFRYNDVPDPSDPDHRPQTVRGFFNKDGLCDSTWTLHYWKSHQDWMEYGESITAVQRAEGWMNTTLWFDSGVLRRERTTQESTGEIIHQFAPPSQSSVPTSRLEVTGSLTHVLDYLSSPSNDDPDDSHWRSPNEKDDDASYCFFIEASPQLDAPMLFDFTLQLDPTAADIALLHQSETVLATAHAQWLGIRSSGGTARPASDTTGAAFRELYLHLYDLLAADRTDDAENASDSRDESGDNSISFRGQGLRDNSGKRYADNPYPWLQALVSAREDSEGEAELISDGSVAAVEKALLAHLKKIQRSMAQVQARLGAAVSH